MITMFSAAINQLQMFAMTCSQGGGFLGFPTWYKYVCAGKSGDYEFQILPKTGNSDIILIVLAVVEIMLRIAALAAVAYIVFGGVKYVVSQGDSNKISEAKGTIINALAGLLIATFAVAIVAFLGNRLGG